MLVSSPKQTRQRLGALFSLPLFFCIVFFLFQLETEKTSIHLLEIQNLEDSVNTLEATAKDSESSERGFLLTGEVTMLSPYEQAKITLPKQITSIAFYSKDRSKLQAELNRLSDLVQRRLDETNYVLALQKQKGFAAAIERTRSGPGDVIMQKLRYSSLSLLGELSNQEDQYLKNQRTLNTGAFVFFGFGTIVMIAVMYWLYNEVLSYIDARDQAQQQLETFNADLQAMVDERTRELVEANRELQQFAYVASHDLQEPLRTITSFSQLMAVRYKGRLEDDADEFIGYIVTASKRMTDLINGLLQIVRLRKAGQPTTRVSFDKLLDDAEASLQAAIRENEVRVERGPMPELMVDRVQMLQVLQNLISNAIKYRRREPPVIHVLAKRNSTEWQFSVADNGRGFSQEFSERIFGLFQRLHGRDVEGTGMGLSIARRIVERHGGRIWAESKEALGSTFFFTLPVSLESAKAAIPAASPGESPKSSLAPRSGKARAL
jgi:signal transduction histidine kinase